MSNTPSAQIKRVDLPDTEDYGTGQWAEIRNPKKVLKGDRDAVRIATFGSVEIDENGRPTNLGAAGVASFDTLLRHWVVAWSLKDADGDPLPIPKDLDDAALAKIDLDVIDKLEDELTPVLNKINGRRDTKVSTDPQSPSAPSAD